MDSNHINQYLLKISDNQWKNLAFNSLPLYCNRFGIISFRQCDHHFTYDPGFNKVIVAENMIVFHFTLIEIK